LIPVSKIEHEWWNSAELLIEQGLTSPPTQYRLSGRWFYRSKDPTNSIKVLKEQKNTQITENYNKRTHKNTANPLVYTNMG